MIRLIKFVESRGKREDYTRDESYHTENIVMTKAAF